MAGVWLGAALVIGALWSSEPSWAPYLSVIVVLGAVVLIASVRGVPVAPMRAALRAQGWRGVVVAAAAVASIVAAATRLPSAVSAAYDGLDHSRPPLTEADLAPLGTYGSVQAYAAAGRLIPPGASFGVDPGGPTPIPFMVWLAPRRWVYPYTSPAVAWLIVYNVPIPTGPRYVGKIMLAPSVYLVRVRR